jgi:hypothetical protein
VNEQDRIEKRDAIATELRRKLREIGEESERLMTVDPLWVFNDIHKMQSLVGQLSDLTYKYRRLT